MKTRLARAAERTALFALGPLYLLFLWHHVISRMPGNAETYTLAMLCIGGCTLFIEVWMCLGRRSFYAFPAACCMLLGIGASYQHLFGNDGKKYLISLLLFYALAVAVFLVMRRSLILSDFWFSVLAAVIVLLLVINLACGRTVRGAALWVRVPLLGSVQIGELVKPLLLLLGASCHLDLRRCVIYSAVSTLWCGALVLILRDLGNAFVIFVMFLFATYLLLDRRRLSLSVIAASAVVFMAAVRASSYAQARITRWLHVMEDTDAYGNVGQQGQMIKAVLLGGFPGLGIEGRSTVTRIVDAQNDLALAGVWAVYGLCFLAIAFLAYALIVRQALCDESVYPASHLILWQFSVLIYCPVLLNFFGSVDVIPFTGIVAPLVSLGGSSMLSLGIAFGLVAAALCPSLSPAWTGKNPPFMRRGGQAPGWKRRVRAQDTYTQETPPEQERAHSGGEAAAESFDGGCSGGVAESFDGGCSGGVAESFDGGCSGGAVEPFDGGCSGGAAESSDEGCSGGAVEPFDGGCSGGAAEPFEGGCSGGAAEAFDEGCPGGAKASAEEETRVRTRRWKGGVTR